MSVRAVDPDPAVEMCGLESLKDLGIAGHLAAKISFEVSRCHVEPAGEADADVGAEPHDGERWAAGVVVSASHCDER